MSARDPTIRVVSYNRWQHQYDYHMPRVILEDERGYLEVHFDFDENDIFCGRGTRLCPCSRQLDEDGDGPLHDENDCGGPITVVEDFEDAWSFQVPEGLTAEIAHRMQDELMADPAGWIMEHRL